MLATQAAKRLQNRKSLLQFETGPSMAEIARRVREIKKSWSVEERKARANEGQRRLDSLANALGLSR